MRKREGECEGGGGGDGSVENSIITLVWLSTAGDKRWRTINSQFNQIKCN